MSQKIVINVRTGGYGLSHEAIVRYAEIKGLNLICEEDPMHQEGWPMYYNYWTDTKDDEHIFWTYDIARDDPALIQTVEELKDKAGGSYARLVIVEIPDDVKWDVCSGEFGHEWVAEKHRTWDGHEDERLGN
jgi:hypothetical protein